MTLPRSKKFKIPTPDLVQARLIVAAVARAFAVPVEEILGKRRFRSIAHARHAAVYLLRVRLEWSYPQLGGYFHQADHTTALRSTDWSNRALRRARDARLTSSWFDEELLLPHRRDAHGPRPRRPQRQRRSHRHRELRPMTIVADITTDLQRLLLLEADVAALRSRPCGHCGALPDGATDVTTPLQSLSSPPPPRLSPSPDHAPLRIAPSTSPTSPVTTSTPPEDLSTLKREQARRRAEAYRRRHGVPARTSCPPPASMSVTLPPPPAALLSFPERDARKTMPALLSFPERDVQRDAALLSPTTRAGFTSFSSVLDDPRSASPSDLATSSSSLLDRINLSGLDSRARANPTSTYTDGADGQVTADPPPAGAPGPTPGQVSPSSAGDPDGVVAESPSEPPDAPLDAPDAVGRRQDRQTWLGVDRCAYAFHAARCADAGCVARGGRPPTRAELAAGAEDCRSKLDWLGFSPRGRGGRVHMRARMYDAVLKCLGAVMKRTPPKTTPHERLVLVVEAFLLHALPAPHGGGGDGGGGRWERFGDTPLRVVDAALARRLRVPERAPSSPPKLTPDGEAAAARHLAERALVDAPRRGNRDATLAKFGNGRPGLASRTSVTRHAPSGPVHPIHRTAPDQQERDASRSSGVHSVTFVGDDAVKEYNDGGGTKEMDDDRDKEHNQDAEPPPSRAGGAGRAGR